MLGEAESRDRGGLYMVEGLGGPVYLITYCDPCHGDQAGTWTQTKLLAAKS